MEGFILHFFHKRLVLGVDKLIKQQAVFFFFSECRHDNIIGGRMDTTHIHDEKGIERPGRRRGRRRRRRWDWKLQNQGFMTGEKILVHKTRFLQQKS